MKAHKFYNLAFSLIELLTIAAILAIFAALSLASYTNYITSTRINALWHQAEPAKLALNSSYIKTHTDPTTVTVTSGSESYTTSNLSYVKCISINEGKIFVLADPDVFQNEELWVAWFPTISSGLLTWSCKYSADAEKYLSDSSSNCAVDVGDYDADIGCTN